MRPTRRLQRGGQPGSKSLKELISHPTRSTRLKWLTFQCSSVGCACLLAIVVAPTFVLFLKPERESEIRVDLYARNAPYGPNVLDLLPPDGQSYNSQLMAQVKSRGAMLYCVLYPDMLG